MKTTRIITAAAIALASLAATPAAAVPSTIPYTGFLNAAGGGPAADGSYGLTFALYENAQGGQAVWTEGPVNKSITSGHFSHQLGSDTPLDAAALGQLGGLYLGVAVGGDPELPRQALGSSLYAVVAGTASTLTCSGCVGANQLAAGAVTADAIDFNYAASDIKGGAATDLACTGCVSVDEMNFDGNVDLGNNALKAAAVNTGSLVATSITATEFVGDGSKLTGVQLPTGSCPEGQVVTGITPSGALSCGSVADSLPKDALDDVSNGVISNEFTDTFTSPDLPLDIKDNFPVGVSTAITVPDVGLAKTMNIKLKLTNSDIKDVQVILYDPNNVEYVLYDKGESGGTLDKTFPDPDSAVQGDLSTWFGKNLQGQWLLKVVDSAFKDNTVDGQITEFSVNINTVSNKKLQVTGDLNVSGDLTPGSVKVPTDETSCDASREGYIRYVAAAKRMEVCDGNSWKAVQGTGSMYRWQVWDTYARWGTGWYADNRTDIFGGVAPSNWSGNYTAANFSSSSQTLRSFFTRKGPNLSETHNALVYNRDSYIYSNSPESRHVAALFRVRNTTESNITWPVSWYCTSYGGWNDYASVAINGSNVWSSGGNNYNAWYERTDNITVPANRTSTVIFVSSTTPESSGIRSLVLAFYNNSLKLPAGLEFVDDLDTKPDGWNN
jgi:subtilisin-like proprotein convertase family protein